MFPDQFISDHRLGRFVKRIRNVDPVNRDHLDCRRFFLHVDRLSRQLISRSNLVSRVARRLNARINCSLENGFHGNPLGSTGFCTHR